MRAREPIHLPSYAGSAWRGVFGRRLRAATCATGLPECTGCLLRSSCTYAYVFETPPPPDATRLRRYPAAPHPFVIAPSWDEARTLESGERFALPVTLVGEANVRLPYVIHAFEQGGDDGLARGAGRYRLERVDQERSPGTDHWQVVHRPGGAPEPLAPMLPRTPPTPEAVRVELRTPLRIVRGGRLVRADRLGFGTLFRALLRRLSLLAYFHTPTPLETDFKALGEAADRLPLGRPRLRWAEWRRYSSRQGAAVPMGGVIGDFELRGPLEPFWPALWLGQWVHAGKGASMGLGRYALEAASLPDRTERAGWGTLRSGSATERPPPAREGRPTPSGTETGTRRDERRERAPRRIHRRTRAR